MALTEILSAADDVEKLIEHKVNKRPNKTSRRPRFSTLRSGRGRLQTSSAKKGRTASKETRNPAAEQQQEPPKPSWDPFAQQQEQSAANTGSSNNNATSIQSPRKPRKKRTPYRILRSAGKRIDRLFRKGAKYLGIAIIKVFNQPGVYTEDSRICVC